MIWPFIQAGEFDMFTVNRKSRGARVAVVALCITAAWAAGAQIINNQPSRQTLRSDAELLRLDLRAHRAEIVMEIMQLTDAETEVFLPIYIDYDAALQNLWNERLKLIAQYASEYDGITDAQAGSLTEDNIGLDGDLIKLRKKYFREFEGALGGRIAARFFQVDRRLNNLLELQAAQSIPIVQ